MARIVLAKNQDRRLRSGHLWVFSNEIASIEGSPEPGGEVLVEDFRGGTVGTGLYNPHSLIAVRLFARRARAIDDALLRERLEQAKALRERILPVESTYRSSTARAISSRASSWIATATISACRASRSVWSAAWTRSSIS
jgi:23S rRNA (cytosine1962-C5)-methyltransferase